MIPISYQGVWFFETRFYICEEKEIYPEVVDL